MIIYFLAGLAIGFIIGVFSICAYAAGLLRSAHVEK